MGWEKYIPEEEATERWLKGDELKNYVPKYVETYEEHRWSSAHNKRGFDKSKGKMAEGLVYKYARTMKKKASSIFMRNVDYIPSKGEYKKHGQY